MILLETAGAFALAVLVAWALLMMDQRRHAHEILEEFEDAYESGEMALCSICACERAARAAGLNLAPKPHECPELP